MSTYMQERRAEDREDRKLQFEAQLAAKQVEAEQRRLDREAAEERQRKADAEKRRLKREEERHREAKKAQGKAASAAKRVRLARWVKANPATLFVAFVMVASIVPAVISQVGALSGAKVPVVLAGLLAAMLEGGAWAITFMGKAAQDSGREARKYRIGTWLTASAAAVVNLWHGLQEYPGSPWVGFVLGGSSLFAIYIWDLKTHGSHGKTRAEKREEKARAKHLSARRSHHKDIALEADRLQSAMPFGTLSDEDAFAAAWRIRRGAEPGMSAELYAAATESRVQLGAAFELGQGVRPELLRNGLMAAALNPVAPTLPTLGPVSPVGPVRITQGVRNADSSSQVSSHLSPPPETPGNAASKGPRKRPVPPVRRKGDSVPFSSIAKVAQSKETRERLGVAAASDGTGRKAVSARLDK